MPNAMTTAPQIEERPEQPYAALARSGPLDALPAAIDAGFPRLLSWLGARGVAPSGPPFIRYVVWDPDAGFEIELGAPVADGVAADGEVTVAALPAGRYLTYVHVGAYRATSARWEGRDLAAAHDHVNRWARERGLAFAHLERERVPALRARVERYLAGPPAVTDPERWRTELAYLLA